MYKATGTMALLDHEMAKEYERLNDSYNEIRHLEPLITADLEQVFNKMNTKFEGTQYAVKTASSIADKIPREIEDMKNELEKRGYTRKNIKIDAKEVMMNLKDIIRYTEICEHDDIVAKTLETTKALEEKGYVLSGRKNYYAAPFPDTEYQGMHLNFISPYGQEIEVQVHSKESFDAKQEGHKYYEQARAVSSALDKDMVLKNQLYKKVKEIHGRIRKPKSYLSLDVVNYKMPQERKEELIKNRRNQIEVYMEDDVVNLENGVAKAGIFQVVMKHDKKDEIGKTLLSGYENIYTDGSARTYQFNAITGEAKLSCIMNMENGGEEITTFPAKPREVTLEEAIMSAKVAEKLNQIFLDEEYKRIGRETDIPSRLIAEMDKKDKATDLLR